MDSQGEDRTGRALPSLGGCAGRTALLALRAGIQRSTRGTGDGVCTGGKGEGNQEENFRAAEKDFLSSFKGASFGRSPFPQQILGSAGFVGGLLRASALEISEGCSSSGSSGPVFLL